MIWLMHREGLSLRT